MMFIGCKLLYRRRRQGINLQAFRYQARSMITQRIGRFAGHLLPLLFLRVAHAGLHLVRAIQAQLDYFESERLQLLRIAGGPGHFDQRLDLPGHLLNEAHELLALLIRDFEFLRDPGPEQGGRSFMVQLQLLEPFELLRIHGLLQERPNFSIVNAPSRPRRAARPARTRRSEPAPSRR